MLRGAGFTDVEVFEKRLVLPRSVRGTVSALRTGIGLDPSETIVSFARKA